MDGRSNTILVTGATGGIGLAVCDRLAQGGRFVVARGTRRRQAGVVVRAIAQHGTHWPHWISVDMTLDESVQQFAQELSARGVVLDGIVLMPPQDPPTADPLPTSERWREILQNSFIGPLAIAQGGDRHDAA
jgi:3-oxoacyl-[acyl-carrier protein] reductase